MSTLARLSGVVLLFAARAAIAQSDTSTTPEGARFDLSRPEIAAFINRVVHKDGLSHEWVVSVLGAGIVRPELTAAMNHPAETELAWWQYRARFLTPERIEAGRRFWQQHQDALNAAATKYGIPAEYLVAILGIETNYGQTPGTYREIDTLMTLAFNYPARAAAFRSELRQFLLLANEMGGDPLLLHGSYGGALGAPQFMPSNYRQFAANHSAGGGVNLWTDWDAVFAAISEFLNERGWQRDGPVMIQASIRDGAHPPVSERLKLNQTIRSLKGKGVIMEVSLPGATRAMLIRAVIQDGFDYRVAFKNFYVISRYNPSTNYAMAVCDLALEVRPVLTEPPAIKQ
jgi:membrane-bound lytic murein transglycosylase B